MNIESNQEKVHLKLILGFKEFSVKTVVEHKVKEKRLQLPHMTKNLIFEKWFGKLTKEMSDCNLQQSRTVNPGEGGESDSQAFNSIIFKCPLFNKNHKCI